MGSFLAAVGYFLLAPVAIHGALKYRMAKTTWRGINFGYRGELNEMIKIYIKGALLTFITFGIYGAWFAMDLRKYIVGNLRAGNAEFDFDGDGKEFFMILIKGLLLTMVTLGIYSFWWIRDIYNYLADHTSVELEGEVSYFHGTATASEVFSVVFVNWLIVVFTLGIGTPWALVRDARFRLENMLLDGNFDPEKLEQTESDYPDATGESLLDALDLDIA